jgi:hypothetical protein
VETAEAQRFATNTYAGRAYVSEQERRYRAIWSILGWNWGNWFFAAARAVNTIPGRDHGELNPAFAITDEQRAAIMVQLNDMGWFRGLQLRPGMYDYLLIMGAKYAAMVNRAIMLRDRLDTTGKKASQVVKFRRLFALSGQRPRTDADRNGRTIDGTVEEIYAGLSDNVKAHDWVKAQMRLMENADAYEEFGGAFGSEFELIILSLIVAYDGQIEVQEPVPYNDEQSLPGVPKRTVESITLVLPDGTEIIAINAPAVERPFGPPRPTSISTTEHLIKNYGLTGGTVVVVTVRVHGRRMLGDSERTIHSIDPSIHVIGYTASIEGDPLEYFAHALAETVNQLVKAVEELLNDLRPAGAKPFDVKAIRSLLDRLHQNPTQGTLMEIINEAMAA